MPPPPPPLVVSAGLVPGFSWALALESQGGPLRVRADATAASRLDLKPTLGLWSVSLELQVLRWGAFSLGPLAGVGQLRMPGACPAMPGIPCDSTVPLWPSSEPAAFLLGVAGRWEAGPWRVTLAPWALMRPRMPLPMFTEAGVTLVPQPPDVLAWVGLAMGPPLLQVDYRLADRLDLSLRTNLAPVALAWRF